ncbi:MAG: cyclophilin-like fold protein [Candidatus Bathyarchaeia archaeon]
MGYHKGGGSGDLSRTRIRIIAVGLDEAEGELVRFLAPRTVEGILRALPLEGKASLWNEEIYFEIPVKMGMEKAKAKVETGTLAYWPIGSAFCIFYGKSQPYSPVNIVGRVTKNLELFASIRSGMTLRVEKAHG